MKTIKIDETELREILKTQLANALDFAWTGWRIPIYAEEDGRLSAGNWLSRGSWQPDAIEVYSLETWNMSDIGYTGEYTDKEDLEEGEEGYNDNDIEHEIEEAIEWIIDDFESAAEENTNRKIELI